MSGYLYREKSYYEIYQSQGRLCFKKIFGSEQSKEILISFLNAIIYNGEKTIESLTIVNPFNPGQIICRGEWPFAIKMIILINLCFRRKLKRINAWKKNCG
ncbi:PD-(D/E)XK nuclease family transposase [Okeania sp. SIO2B3]|uniref:PD-(D/E)XK nuclease family transposase n=1 Tax=Okeania sp. SIO2B3 TaxID=2607784 RepID=UPI00342E4843